MPEKCRKKILFFSHFSDIYFFRTKLKAQIKNKKKQHKNDTKTTFFSHFQHAQKLPYAKPHLANAKTKFTQTKNKIYHTQKKKLPYAKENLPCAKKIYHAQKNLPRAKKFTIRKKNLPYAKKNLPYAKKTSIRITPPTAHTSTLFYLQVENCNASRLRLHFRRLIIGIRCLSRRSFFQSSTSFTGVNGL